MGHKKKKCLKNQKDNNNNNNNIVTRVFYIGINIITRRGPGEEFAIDVVV